MTADQMNYDIRLTIGYTYGGPSEHARTLVRLMPSDLIGRQDISTKILDIDPIPTERRDITDFFGNVATILAYNQPIDHIEFNLRARATRWAPFASLDLSPNLVGLAEDLLDVRSVAPFSPHHYVVSSPRIPRDDAIEDFAASVAKSVQTTRQIVTAIGLALHSEMKFDPVATNVDTVPGEAFANRHGVCQDFSHVMIAALRSLGVPALYVSGFLRTIPPAGQARLEGADAMHAWVSAWCGAEMGWVEFDPTNACFVGLDHIAVAYGRDYSDVSPVKGTLRTSGDQTSFQQVDIEPVIQN